MNSCVKCDKSTGCKYNDYEESCQNCLFDLSYVDRNKEDPCDDCLNGSNFVYYAIGKSL